MRHFLISFSVLSICLSVLLTSQTSAQLSQLQILIGTGYTGSPQEGSSVALSADGNTAIIGGIADNSVQGATWVFTRSGGVWSQEGSKLVGTGATGAALQGVSVALSSDGNTAIVGGMGDNSYAGAAWIFTRTAGVWSQQGTKLVGTGGVGAGEQGFAVALSADGNTAISGGYLDNSSQGAVWVFTRTGGVWSQQGSKLIGTGNSGGAYQGYSVALSSDGNTAILGGYKDNTYSGAAWIFTRSGVVWSQQSGKLVGSDNQGVAEQGFSVSLSSDGNTALFGGIADNSGCGATWVFTRSGGLWSQLGNKLVGTGGSASANQGYSVSLSSDGITAISGGGNDVDKGAVWVFASSGGVWSQQGSKLVGANGSSSAKQGYSVSLSGDATTAIWGGWTDYSNTGAAWVFETPSAPLSVELTEFYARAQAGEVRLTWHTVTEVNNYGFEIERRLAAPPAGVESWNKIGFVSGTGTSSGPKEYSYTDNSVSSGRYTYRIKLIDKDGSYKYTQIAEVEVGLAPKAFTLSQNYPNPFNPSTMLEFTFEQNGNATVKIYNMLGQEVATVFNQKAEAGRIYQAQFNAARFTSGVYMSVLESGGKRLFRKMLLVK